VKVGAEAERNDTADFQDASDLNAMADADIKARINRKAVD